MLTCIGHSIGPSPREPSQQDRAAAPKPIRTAAFDRAYAFDSGPLTIRFPGLFRRNVSPGTPASCRFARRAMSQGMARNPALALLRSSEKSNAHRPMSERVTVHYSGERRSAGGSPRCVDQNE
jgi:hypothetical protein